VDGWVDDWVGRTDDRFIFIPLFSFPCFFRVSFILLDFFPFFPFLPLFIFFFSVPSF